MIFYLGSLTDFKFVLVSFNIWTSDVQKWWLFTKKSRKQKTTCPEEEEQTMRIKKKNNMDDKINKVKVYLQKYSGHLQILLDKLAKKYKCPVPLVYVQDHDEEEKKKLESPTFNNTSLTSTKPRSSD